MSEEVDILLDQVRSMPPREAWNWSSTSPGLDLTGRFVEAYARLAEHERVRIRTTVDGSTCGTLLMFAQFMATLAVREYSLERLRLGLMALALAGSASVGDWRDMGMITLPLRDAASRLGPGSLVLFDEAAQVATSRVATTFRSAKPSFSLFGRVAQEASRLFAQDFWRPTGTGRKFKYGQVGADQ